MAFDPERDELDRDVESSMRIFERAQIGPVAAVIPIKPTRVLLVLDGSDQDQTGLDAARHLEEACGCETLVLDARESAVDARENAASKFSAQLTRGQPIKRPDGDAYEAILTAVGEHAPELVIVPCPFGRAFEAVGADSAGTVIDVLLARASVALLVIRRLDQRLADCVGRIALIVAGECDAADRAAGWTFGLASPRATLTLNLVVEKEEFENIRSIIQAVSPGAPFSSETLAEALAKTHQRLHVAMAKTADQTGLTYRLLPQAGEVAPPNPLQSGEQQLLVLPLEVDDRYGQGFVRDRISHSPHPLLVVPSHAPREQSAGDTY